MVSQKGRRKKRQRRTVNESYRALGKSRTRLSWKTGGSNCINEVLHPELLSANFLPENSGYFLLRKSTCGHVWCGQCQHFSTPLVSIQPTKMSRFTSTVPLLDIRCFFWALTASWKVTKGRFCKPDWGWMLLQGYAVVSLHLKRA